MSFDFIKNATPETLDNVPAQFQGLYEANEAGDGFQISENAKGVVGLLNGTVAKLAQTSVDKKSASDESASRRLQINAYKELATELGIEGDDVIQGLRDHVTQLSDQVKGGKEANVNVDKIRSEFSAREAQKDAAREAELEAMRGTLRKTLVSEVSSREIAAQKGVPALLSHVVDSQTKVIKTDNGEYAVRVVDEAGDVRYNGEGNPMTVRDLVGDLKNDATYSRAFVSDAKPGSGTIPGSTKAPAGQQAASGAVANSATQNIAEGLASRM